MERLAIAALIIAFTGLDASAQGGAEGAAAGAALETVPKAAGAPQRREAPIRKQNRTPPPAARVLPQQSPPIPAAPR